VPAPEVITIPKTISHFVMNLPATAIAFLPSFSGLYATQEQLFEPHTQTKLPMVHVHCFSTKSDDNVKEGLEIAERVSKELGVEMRVGKEEEMGLEGVVYVREVRDVAPKKRMFCASFRVPKEVAFRSR
jgi:tRNA (guanine37-N1)-methyltransferase